MTNIKPEFGVSFDGATVEQRQIYLWDAKQQPPLVLRVHCDVLKDALNQPTLSDEECRFLADHNRNVLADLAGKLREGALDRMGRAALEATLNDMRPIANRLVADTLSERRRLLHSAGG